MVCMPDRPRSVVYHSACSMHIRSRWVWCWMGTKPWPSNHNLRWLALKHPQLLILFPSSGGREKPHKASQRLRVTTAETGLLTAPFCRSQSRDEQDHVGPPSDIDSTPKLQAFNNIGGLAVSANHSEKLRCLNPVLETMFEISGTRCHVEIGTALDRFTHGEETSGDSTHRKSNAVWM